MQLINHCIQLSSSFIWFVAVLLSPFRFVAVLTIFVTVLTIFVTVLTIFVAVLVCRRFGCRRFGSVAVLVVAVSTCRRFDLYPIVQCTLTSDGYVRLE